jgi:hypothetical protein
MKKTLNEIRLENIKKIDKKRNKELLKDLKEMKKNKIKFFKKLKKDVIEAIKNNDSLLYYNCELIYRNVSISIIKIIKSFLNEQKEFNEFIIDVKHSYLRYELAPVYYIDITWRLKDDQIQTS